MAVDHRLVMLRQALDRASVSDGRTVVMVARVTPALGVGDLSCLAPLWCSAPRECFDQAIMPTAMRA